MKLDKLFNLFVNFIVLKYFIGIILAPIMLLRELNEMSVVILILLIIPKHSLSQNTQSLVTGWNVGHAVM